MFPNPVTLGSRMKHVRFCFSDHVLDVDLRELTRAGAGIAVEPQVFDLLIYLVQNRERVVSKDDLIASVWGGRIVSDSTLASRINAARKAIGDSGEEQRLIRTTARRGIRFIGAVHTPSQGGEPARSPNLRRRSSRSACAPLCHPTGPPSRSF